MTAGDTRTLMNRLGMPNYEKGIGFEDTKLSHLTRRIRDINTTNRSNEQAKTIYTANNTNNQDQAILRELVDLKSSVENLLGKLLEKDFNT